MSVSVRRIGKAAGHGLDRYAALASLDWSFPERRNHSPLEGMHPYPAKFISEIPEAILSALPPAPGDTVLDPFCGSGTTLAAAQAAGFASVGIDLNPIACLISRVRTAARPTGLVDAADALVDRCRSSIGTVEVPDIPNLAHWFRKDVGEALAVLTGRLGSMPEGPLRDALSLALSSIIVRVSNQDSDTRYAAVEKTVDGASVFDGFGRAAARIDGALAGRTYPLLPVKVVERDTLAVAPEDLRGPVGLVITSPPYPNAYEYWLYHKYRMWWLGKDPLAVKRQEIGARAHFFRKDPHTPEHFSRQMGGVLDLLASRMTPGGHACFVVGRSKIRGEIVDNARLIEAEAERRGFVRRLSVEREIAATRKSFNLSHANIKTETVLVLEAGAA